MPVKEAERWKNMAVGETMTYLEAIGLMQAYVRPGEQHVMQEAVIR